MKNKVDTVDATPSKRTYLSIIADYDVNKAICELVDNALDIWSMSRNSSKLSIDIELDCTQQRISVIDNAGGIKKSELTFVVAPGFSSNSEFDETIGIFGVGTKRAVVALAQDIKIRTRNSKETYQVEFDDSWINQSDDWELPVYRVDSISRGSTQIELVKLRRQITNESVDQLREHLGVVYAKFIKKRNIGITLNSQSVKRIDFESWAYPPNFEPRSYSGLVATNDGKTVKLKAIAGLSLESSPAGGEYGVYFYCNDRLVARSLKTIDVGFGSGLAGKPHADISLARVIISINGEARLMPWNSSKSDINTSHEVFVAIRSWLVQVIKDYSSLSRRLSKFEGGWPENVFRYKKGTAKRIRITDFPTVNTSYLPPLPEMRPRYANVVLRNNKKISEEKPWTTGLYESIIAVDWVTKQHFEQKNRLALIILDSTLEIAFKEFLVNDSGVSYSETRLSSIFSNRTQVHKEVEK